MTHTADDELVYFGHGIAREKRELVHLNGIEDEKG
jgi:hypothetical protein